jgi:pimeloyl-ACP methyl ester carboxylesterase
MGLAYPAAMWFRLMPGLTRQHRVLRVDNRGAGWTGEVDAECTVEAMARDCLAVLDAAEVPSAHVVGLSMGGLIAQELCHIAGERARSLCLMATHAGVAHAVFDPEALAVLAARTELSVEEAADLAVPFNYAAATSRTLIEEDWSVRFPLAATPRGYMAQLAGSMTWSGFDRLATLDVPTLVLHGAQDRLVPPANGRELAERIPGAELHVVEGANHILMTDQTDEVRDTLLAWFARHP